MVEVRQRLADGEHQLVRVERAVEHHAGHLGDGARLRTGVRDLLQPLAMMSREGVQPGMQAGERRIVGRQDEEIVGKVPQPVEGAQEILQRVGVRFR